MQLYDYQIDLINRASQSMKNAERLVIQSPTGSGKTVIMSEIIQRLAIKKGKNILILSDLQELKRSTLGTIHKFVNSAVELKDANLPQKQVVIAMAQTVNRRLRNTMFRSWLLRFDYFIIDECHMSFNNELINEIIIPHGRKLIGFSATPIMSVNNRLLLGDLYQDMIHGLYTIELIEKQRLAKPEYIISGLESTSDFKIKHFEFDPQEVRKKFEDNNLYDNLIENITKYKRQNNQSLVFCNDIFHAYKTCEKLNNAGIKSKCLTSTPIKPKTPTVSNPLTEEMYRKKNAEYEFVMSAMQKYSGNRSDIIKSWERGEYFYLCNSEILMTGFDAPTCTDIHLFYSGLSWRVLNQKIGRGSRFLAGLKEHFFVYDYGRNIENLAPWETAINYKLHKKSDFESTAKDKKKVFCPICNMPMLTNICSCGYELAKFRIVEQKEEVKTEIQKVLTYKEVKESFANYDLDKIIQSKEMNEKAKLRYIWIRYKHSGIANYILANNKDIYKTFNHLDYCKYGLTENDKLLIKVEYKKAKEVLTLAI